VKCRDTTWASVSSLPELHVRSQICLCHISGWPNESTFVDSEITRIDPYASNVYFHFFAPKKSSVYIISSTGLFPSKCERTFVDMQLQFIRWRRVDSIVG